MFTARKSHYAINLSISILIIIIMSLSGCFGDNSTAVNPGGSGRDSEIPVLTDFTLTSSDQTTNPEISFTLTGSDNIGITSWMINESSTKPDAGDPDWISVKPGTYTLSSVSGLRTVYAWAKDLAGNVSDSLSFTLNLDMHPPAQVDVILADYDPRLPTVTLRWTAVADDGDTGAPASSYEIHYSRSPIQNEDDWNNSCNVEDLPHTSAVISPASPGTEEIYVI